MGKQPLPKSSSFGDVTSPNGDSQDEACKYPEFKARLHSAAESKGLNSAKIASNIGITRGTMARYWDGDRLPPAEHLVSISELLDVTESWLIRGRDSRVRGHLADVADAEWVVVPEYDLREMTDASKGPVVSETPFRRDWLQNNLGHANGIWVTRLPVDYPALGLLEGDLVFARDVAVGEAKDKALYIFRVDGALTVARLNALAETGLVNNRAGEDMIPFRHFGIGEGKAAPVARILGVPLMRV